MDIYPTKLKKPHHHKWSNWVHWMTLNLRANTVFKKKLNKIWSFYRTYSIYKYIYIYTHTNCILTRPLTQQSKKCSKVESIQKVMRCSLPHLMIKFLLFIKYMCENSKEFDYGEICVRLTEGYTADDRIC